MAPQSHGNPNELGDGLRNTVSQVVQFGRPGRRATSESTTTIDNATSLILLAVVRGEQSATGIVSER